VVDKVEDKDGDGFKVGPNVPPNLVDPDDNNAEIKPGATTSTLGSAFTGDTQTFRQSISVTTKAEATADMNAAFMEQFGTNAPKEVIAAYFNELRALQSTRISGGESKDKKTTVNIQGVSGSEIKALQNKYVTANATKLITAANAGDVKAVAALQRGNFGLTYTSLKNAYAENGLPINIQSLGKLTVESAVNPALLKSNLNLINMQAKTYFPALSDKIDKGYTVKQLLTPYINTRANILEEDPDSIDISTLKSVASDPKNLMNLYEYEISLRKDPKWRFTKNAQDSLSNVARSIAKTFGLVG
jgi:hypothetical protein